VLDAIRALLPRLSLKQTIVISSLGAVLGGGAITPIIVLIVLGAMGGTITGPPEQPIAFDHVIHAGDAGIACEFCHRGIPVAGDPPTATSVPLSAAATIPSVAQCMFCHTVIATDSSEIQEVQAAWDTGTAIEWTRVHRMPDHVDFVHDPHIRALREQRPSASTAEICTTCHGDVAAMPQVEQVRSLNMGDCQNCHRENSAPLDCAVCHK
jgi:hypothetical protein